MVDAVFYSDQIIPANEKVDIRLLELMRGRGRRIGYIPSGPEPSRRFYSERQAYYGRMGLGLDLFHDMEGHHGAVELEALLGCDAIHLSGGKTSAFLARLKRFGMLERLRAWANNGGLLIGTSAGAIIMTPTIAVDALFDDAIPGDAEDNAAMDLVPFEFFPHLQAKPSYLPRLLAYSARTSRPVVACADGDGVVVAGGVVELIGEPLLIVDGSIAPVKEVAIAALRG